MTYLLLGYGVISIIAGVSAWINVDWSVGLGLLVTSKLSWWAGSGLRGSIIDGRKNQIIGGVAMTVLLLSIAILVAHYTGFRVKIFDAIIDGKVWGMIGFAIGYLVVRRKNVFGEDKKDKEN